MQALWSRTAQTRCTCKCAFCHATTALSRTSTTSALKRRLRFRDVFTVFYSTVLASAAVADSCGKDARRREWEAAIQKTKEELAAMENAQLNRIAALSTETNGLKVTDGPWVIENTWDKVFGVASHRSQERESLGFEGLVGPPLHVLKQLATEEIAEVLRDPAIVRLNTNTQIVSDLLWRPKWYGVKKTKTLEWSIRKLVYRILLSCETERSQTQLVGGNEESDQMHPDKTISQTIMSRIEKCEQALKFMADNPQDRWLWLKLRSPTVPSYSRQINPEGNSMNDQLLTLFESFRPNSEGPTVLLSSICSLLLSTPIAPDVDFYNILITRLCQMQRMADVQIVIDSMNECWIRPNETTLFALLHYYTITSKALEFLDLSKRMAGLHSRPLIRVHPDKKAAPCLQRRYIAREYSKPELVITDKDHKLLDDDASFSDPSPDELEPKIWSSYTKVFQTARMGLMNHQVYEALISGSLKFGWPGMAMDYYGKMVTDGFKPDPPLLESILEYCTRKRDWSAGVAVWKELRSSTQRITHAMLGLMLTLCRSLGKYVEYGEVLDHGVQLGLIASASSDFPEEIGQGLMKEPLDVADIVLFPRQPSLQTSISRDSLERAIDRLAFGIANISLDLALLDIGHRKENIGFKIYLKIKRQHRDGVAGIARRARETESQYVSSHNGLSTARTNEQRLSSSEEEVSIQPPDGLYTKHELSLEEEQAREVSRNQRREVLPETENTVIHESSAEQSDAPGSTTTDGAHGNCNEDHSFFTTVSKRGEEDQIFVPKPEENVPQKPLMELITNLSSLGEVRNHPSIAPEDDVPKLEKFEQEDYLMTENPPPSYSAKSKQVSQAVEQYHHSSSSTVDSIGPHSRDQQTPDPSIRPSARHSFHPDNLVSVTQPSSPLEISVRAVVEGDQEFEQLSQLRFVSGEDDQSDTPKQEMDDEPEALNMDEYRDRLSDIISKSILYSPTADISIPGLAQRKGDIWRPLTDGARVEALTEEDHQLCFNEVSWDVPVSIPNNIDQEPNQLSRTEYGTVSQRRAVRRWANKLGPSVRRSRTSDKESDILSREPSTPKPGVTEETMQESRRAQGPKQLIRKQIVGNNKGSHRAEYSRRLLALKDSEEGERLMERDRMLKQLRKRKLRWSAGDGFVLKGNSEAPLQKAYV